MTSAWLLPALSVEATMRDWRQRKGEADCLHVSLTSRNGRASPRGLLRGNISNAKLPASAENLSCFSSQLHDHTSYQI